MNIQKKISQRFSQDFGLLEECNLMQKEVFNQPEVKSKHAEVIISKSWGNIKQI